MLCIKFPCVVLEAVGRRLTTDILHTDNKSWVEGDSKTLETNLGMIYIRYLSICPPWLNLENTTNLEN